MKPVAAHILLLAACAASVAANALINGNTNTNANVNVNSAAPSYGGQSYEGTAYVPSPPCARNYLFSCQPHLSPAPCTSQPDSYGAAGAYSYNRPIYVPASLYEYQGLRALPGLRAY